MKYSFLKEQDNTPLFLEINRIGQARILRITIAKITSPWTRSEVQSKNSKKNIEKRRSLGDEGWAYLRVPKSPESRINYGNAARRRKPEHYDSVRGPRTITYSGWKWSDESRNNFKKRRKSASHIFAISNALRGVPKSEIHKNKISETMKTKTGENAIRSRKVMKISTKKIYVSAKAAAEENNINYSNMKVILKNPLRKKNNSRFGKGKPEYLGYIEKDFCTLEADYRYT